METKKIIYSGVVLLLIIAAMLISSLLENSKEKKTFAPFFPKFSEQAGKIVLTQRENSVTLSKKDNKWFVSFTEVPELQYPADSVKVLSVIQKIAEMKKDNFVGKNSENFTQYGLDGDSVYSVQIFDQSNNQIGDFLLGKRSENWRFNYFKIAGNDNSVYLVGGGIGYAFKAEINEWRDKKMFDFNPKEVIEIIALENTTIKSVKKDTTGIWTFSDGSPANADTISGYINEFAELTAGDWDYSYSTPDSVTGLLSPSARYTLISKDSSQITLTVGNVDGDRPRHFVRYNNNMQTAFVFNSQISRLRFLR